MIKVGRWLVKDNSCVVEYLIMNYEQRKLRAMGLEDDVEIVEINKIIQLDMICY
ncbi:MAG TPA: hypothetical protein PL078_02465 [Bacillota bacterium]|nr:hypothetical protein [Peptococcaceae bacterium]HPZ42844.1 hypothetical protein [Bacillota bacterium]HQD75599.1 hypothetical protein [Bacillota bacterium]HUM58214.1 hypothetical protein [Bacillota bacterium]